MQIWNNWVPWDQTEMLSGKYSVSFILSLEKCFSTISLPLKYLDSLLETARSYPWSFWYSTWEGWGEGLRISLCNRFPRDADAADLGDQSPSTSQSHLLEQ